MKRRRSGRTIALVLVCAAVAGVVAGMSWRRWPKISMGNGDLATPSQENGIVRSTKNIALPGTNSEVLSVPQKLARELSLSSGVTKWLHWMDAIEKARLEDFPRLAQMTAGDAKAAKMVATRWAELDPKRFFDALVAANGWPVEEMAQVLFDDWVKRDPDAVIAALSETKNLGAFKHWRWQVAGKFMEQNTERGLQLFSQWHIEDYIPNMKPVEQWARANPQHAAEFALANPAGYVTRTVMETVGKAWARNDPGKAMNFAASQRGEFVDVLARSALKTWAEENLEEAGQWLVSTDALNRNRMSAMFVEGWAKKEPRMALQWSEENLSGSAYAEAASAVMKSAKNVEEAAKLVSEMAPSAARRQAAVAVGERWLPSWGNESRSADPKAVAWLASLDEASLSKVVEQTQWSWSSSDPKGFAEFLAGQQNTDLPASAFGALSRALARQDPAGAMEWAERLPTGSRFSAGRQIFQEWWHSQTDAALSWFRGLSESDPRRNILFTGIMFEVAHDPGGPAQLAKLNQSERVAAEKLLPGIGMPDEQRKNLLAAVRTAE